MAEEFGFKDLKVWHKSVDFADKIIGIIDNLNSARKHFRLLEQIEAASTSISSNTADLPAGRQEGRGVFQRKSSANTYIFREAHYMNQFRCLTFVKDAIGYQRLNLTKWNPMGSRSQK